MLEIVRTDFGNLHKLIDSLVQTGATNIAISTSLVNQMLFRRYFLLLFATTPREEYRNENIANVISLNDSRIIFHKGVLSSKRKCKRSLYIPLKIYSILIICIVIF